jgi:hypothetical protein
MRWTKETMTSYGNATLADITDTLGEKEEMVGVLIVFSQKSVATTVQAGYL